MNTIMIVLLNALSLTLFVYVLREQRMPKKLETRIGAIGMALILASIIGSASIGSVDEGGLKGLLAGTMPLVLGPYTALIIVGLLKFGGIVARTVSYLRGNSDDENNRRGNVVTLPNNESKSLAKAA